MSLWIVCSDEEGETSTLRTAEEGQLARYDYTGIISSVCYELEGFLVGKIAVPCV